MVMVTTNYPAAPVAVKRKATLLDTVTVETGIENLDGLALFESHNSLTFGAEAEFCAPNAKDLTQASEWVDGFRFAAYGGLTCKPIGTDASSLASKARAAFEQSESTAVEAALMKYRFVENLAGAGLPGEWSAPTDLTPTGGAVSPTKGVALLEGFAAREYIGLGTLHVPVTAASLLLVDSGLMWEGDRLYTALGSKVVAGAGYDLPNTGPTGVAAAAGERWMYITGEVLIRQGREVIVRDAFDEVNNDHVVLAERGYVVAVDGFAAAVRVTV